MKHPPTISHWLAAIDFKIQHPAIANWLAIFDCNIAASSNDQLYNIPNVPIWDKMCSKNSDQIHV